MNMPSTATSTSLDATDVTPAVGAPAVTVLMAVHNAETHLREAIDSILGQTFTDFEFLIYNDGSTDGTAAVVCSYTDPRIVFVDNAVNRSVSPNLNEGLARARGRYIVRMDGDDIAYPVRIARQVAFMDAYPEVGLCGTAVRYIGASHAIVRMPETDEAIQHSLWLYNAFYQPSVIIRMKTLRDHNLWYNTDFEFAEDYKLWSDMSSVTKLRNLPEVLLDYRIHAHQISRRKSKAQQQVSAQIRKEQLQRLHIPLKPTQEHAFQLLNIDDDWGDFEPQDYAEVAALLEDLGQQAKRISPSPAAMYQVLGQQWGRVLNAAKRYSPALIPYVLQFTLSKHLPPSTVVKLLAKCLVYWKVR